MQVDQPDMIAFKRERLRASGAQTEPDLATGCPAADYPLKAASWAGVAADLMQPEWPDALLAAGFRPGSAAPMHLAWYRDTMAGRRAQQQCSGCPLHPSWSMRLGWCHWKCTALNSVCGCGVLAGVPTAWVAEGLL